MPGEILGSVFNIKIGFAMKQVVWKLKKNKSPRSVKWFNEVSISSNFNVSQLNREYTESRLLPSEMKKLRLGQTLGDLLPLCSKTGKVVTSSF